jgi:hypothetical protein
MRSFYKKKQNFSKLVIYLNGKQLAFFKELEVFLHQISKNMHK